MKGRRAPSRKPLTRPSANTEPPFSLAPSLREERHSDTGAYSATSFVIDENRGASSIFLRSVNDNQ
jgi:hypothetical protein